MILKSKFRPDISLLTICIVGLMLIAPYPAYLKISASFDEGYLKEPSIILLFIFIDAPPVLGFDLGTEK